MSHCSFVCDLDSLDSISRPDSNYHYTKSKMQNADGDFCKVLLKLVKDSSEKRWTKTATFYAEKLLTLRQTPSDVYLFAQVSPGHRSVHKCHSSTDSLRQSRIPEGSVSDRKAQPYLAQPKIRLSSWAVFVGMQSPCRMSKHDRRRS